MLNNLDNLDAFDDFVMSFVDYKTQYERNISLI